MTVEDPRDRADDAIVEALLHRLADPVDLTPAVRAALARTDGNRQSPRRRGWQVAFAAAAAAVTAVVFFLAKGGSEAERWLDRAIAVAHRGADQDYRLQLQPSPIEGRLLLRGDQRAFVDVRGPLDALALRAGVGRDEAWTLSGSGELEVGKLAEFGTEHPLARVFDLVHRSLLGMRGVSDLELVEDPSRPLVVELRSARADVHVVLTAPTGEVERLDVPWFVGRLSLVRLPSSQKHDLVYEHASYHAPGVVAHAPTANSSWSTVFGFGGDRPRPR